MKSVLIKLSIAVFLIIISMQAFSLTISPREDSDVLSNADKILVVKEFGDWLDSCNYIVIGQDTEDKIESCKYLRYFMEYGWKHPFSAL